MKEVFKAIHCNEIETIFTRLGLSDKFLNHQLLCSNCGSVITKNTFGALTRKSGKIILCCNSADCYTNFLVPTS